LGRIGELLMKAEFLKRDFDVYSTEVDNDGIDFVVKNLNKNYFDIQVKATNQKYIFMKKAVFQPRGNLYLAMLILDQKQNNHFLLIPSLDFLNNTRDSFLVDRNYEGKISPPEYGIYSNGKYLKALIDKYSFEKIVTELEKSG